MAKGDTVIGERGEVLEIVWDGSHNFDDADLLLTFPYATQRDYTGDACQLRQREPGGLSLRKFGRVHSAKGAA